MGAHTLMNHVLLLLSHPFRYLPPFMFTVDFKKLLIQNVVNTY